MDNLPAVITVDKVRGELNIALTRAQYSIQHIQTEADKLTFSEDDEGLRASTDFQEKVKNMFDVIETAHKAGKAPAWEECKTRDEANRSLLKTIKDIVDPKLKKHQELSTKLANAAKEKKTKEASETRIRMGIAGSIIQYSNLIAAAQTVEELTRIELSISNQKSPSAKNKYGDLHQEAIEIYNTQIIPLLKSKKEGLQSLAEMECKIEGAETLEDMDAIQSSIDQTRNEIQDAEVTVQENALNTYFVPTSTYTEIIPEVKAKRTTIEFELLEARKAFDRVPKLLVVELDREANKTIGKALFALPENKDKEELVVNGIRYYKKRVY